MSRHAVSTTGRGSRRDDRKPLAFDADQQHGRIMRFRVGPIKGRHRSLRRVSKPRTPRARNTPRRQVSTLDSGTSNSPGKSPVDSPDVTLRDSRSDCRAPSDTGAEAEEARAVVWRVLFRASLPDAPDDRCQLAADLSPLALVNGRGSRPGRRGSSMRVCAWPHPTSHPSRSRSLSPG